MPYLLIANLLVFLHLAFVGFVVLGALLVLRWPRLAWIQLPCALWGALIEFAGWICPLTPLETRFRQLGGQAGYAGSFIEHYLLPVLYPKNLTRPVQLALGMLVLILNAAAYGRLWRRRASGTA
ncbi:MAG: DUF2784 domain-containing protein [candidate division NC10 bacterium]|nr:DUF2784 domain-containing protein [candidate division NC10 bacterium]